MKLGFSEEPKWLLDSLAPIVRSPSIALRKRNHFESYCFPSFRPIGVQSVGGECANVRFITFLVGSWRRDSERGKSEYQEKKKKTKHLVCVCVFSSPETMETKLGHCTNFILFDLVKAGVCMDVPVFPY